VPFRVSPIHGSDTPFLCRRVFCDLTSRQISVNLRQHDGIQPLHGDAQVPVISNRVPPVDRLGLVSCQLHRDAPRDARAFEVAYSGPAQIVRNAPRAARLLAGCLERLPNALVRFMFESFENMFFRPSWWKALDAAVKSALMKRFWNIGVFADTSAKRLIDDGHHCVDWKVTSRTWLLAPN
jgi:hypothetical protein